MQKNMFFAWFKQVWYFTNTQGWWYAPPNKPYKGYSLNIWNGSYHGSVCVFFSKTDDLYIRILR